MTPFDLIATARKLLVGDASQADLRRAVSTAYYALFHQVCFSFSTIVLHPENGEFRRAYTQAYRYIDHGVAKRRCEQACDEARTFPAELVQFAEAFVDLQQKRAEADYDPLAVWTDAQVHTVINDAAQAIEAFEHASVECQRAFAIFLGLRTRR